MVILPEQKMLSEKLMPSGGILGNITLQLQSWPAREEGIIITLDADGTPCDFWLPIGILKNWCENVLGTANWTLISQPLLTSIVAWGLSPLLSTTKLTMPLWTFPRLISILKWDLTVTFIWNIEKQIFKGVLMALPASVWKRLINAVTPITRTSNTLFPLKGILSIGESNLTIQELSQIKPGMGIRLKSDSFPSIGKYKLILPGGVILRITWIKKRKSMVIDSLMHDIILQLEQGSDIDNPIDNLDTKKEKDNKQLISNKKLHLDSLPQRIRVDVGQITLTVGMLRQLAVGDVVPVISQFSPYATLSLQGRILGQGELIRCESSLLLRIVRWYLT